MKKGIVASALMLGLLTTFCHADDAEQERIRELERRLADLEKQKSGPASQPDAPTEKSASAIYQANGHVNPKISNAVVIIKGDKSVGTGFVVSTEGKNFVYTAAHVFSGNSKLSISNSSGTEFKKFGNFEAAEGADLVRLEMLDEVTEFLEILPASTPLEINTPIAALGNGGGNGVISVEPGKVLGTSGDILEVDAGVIQGNSGGPVVVQSSGKAVGVVTHLTSERKDVWAQGTRQGEVRRFACRLNKEWQWKVMKIGAFLADSRALSEFDELTRLCFAVAHLQPERTGLRMDTNIKGNINALQILDANKDNDLVKSLLRMNTELASKKTGVSDADLRKKFSSLLSQIHSRATRSNETFKPQNFAWFHRDQAKVSVMARKECLDAIKSNLDGLK